VRLRRTDQQTALLTSRGGSHRPPRSADFCPAGAVPRSPVQGRARAVSRSHCGRQEAGDHLQATNTVSLSRRFTYLLQDAETSHGKTLIERSFGKSLEGSRGVS
jgi:hypothetical protein